jgi:hypothetical protein
MAKDALPAKPIVNVLLSMDVIHAYLAILMMLFSRIAYNAQQQMVLSI